MKTKKPERPFIRFTPQECKDKIDHILKCAIEKDQAKNLPEDIEAVFWETILLLTRERLIPGLLKSNKEFAAHMMGSAIISVYSLGSFPKEGERLVEAIAMVKEAALKLQSTDSPVLMPIHDEVMDILRDLESKLPKKKVKK
jgi:hypothetical protein